MTGQGTTRRSFIAGAAALSGAAAAGLLRPAEAAASADYRALAKSLIGKFGADLRYADRAAIVDFSLPSWRERLFLVDFSTGGVRAMRVAHGRGSDPAHSGWLRQFSNDVGSKATSKGAYLTGEIYSGKYGRALRLDGLEAENANARRRAIVVHPAWYAEAEMVRKIGRLGRSEGCFALSQDDCNAFLETLGPGRLLYAGKF